MDKLTFIVCLPLLTPTIPGEVGIDGGKGKVSTTCYAGVDDADMVGDVNLFLTPCHEADDGEFKHGLGRRGCSFLLMTIDFRK